MFQSRPLTKEEIQSIDNIIFDFGGVLFDKLETGSISNPDFYSEVRNALDVKHSDEILEEAWNTILTGIPKGRIDLIHELKSKYKTYLFSNTNAIHVSEFEKMVDTEMTLEYFYLAFEKVYYSNVLGFKKPYPESFLKYCTLESLEPSKTLFIDDSVQHVEGAEKAGLMAFHLDVKKMDVREIFSALL